MSEKSKAVCREDQPGESTSEEANEAFLNALVPDVSTAEIPESATNIFVFFGVGKRREGEKEQRERLDVTKHKQKPQQGRRCKSANKRKSTAGEAAATASARQVKAKTNASTNRRKGRKATKPQVKGRQRGENEGGGGGGLERARQREKLLWAAQNLRCDTTLAASQVPVLAARAWPVLALRYHAGARRTLQRTNEPPPCPSSSVVPCVLPSWALAFGQRNPL